MTIYQLWFKYGRTRKISPPLLIQILRDMDLIEITKQDGEILCVSKTDNLMEDSYEAISAYRRLLPWLQVSYFFKAVRQWSTELQPLEKVS